MELGLVALLIMVIVYIKLDWKNLNLKYKIIVMCLPIIIIGIFIASIMFRYANPSRNIKGIEYKLVTNNLYYTDRLLENKFEDKNTIYEYCKILSGYLNEKYPEVSFYVKDFVHDKTDIENNSIYFYVEQLIDGKVIVSNTGFYLNMKDRKINELDDHLTSECEENFVYDNISTDTNLTIKDVRKTGLELAKKHTNEIFYAGERIRILEGECILEYNPQNKLFYRVVLNHGSYINIDAKTGEVIDSKFYNSNQ